MNLNYGFWARVIRFCIVGSLTACGYFLVAESGFLITHSAPAASAIGYLAMLPFSFLGHKHWTFRSTAQSENELWKFVTVSLIALSFSILTPIIGAHDFEFPPATLFALTCVAVPSITFVSMQTWVFVLKDRFGRAEDLQQ